MKNIIKIKLLFIGMIFSGIISVFGQTKTVGLILNDSSKSFKGYTLFAPLKSTKTYLIDMNGMLVHSWTSSYSPGQSVRLLPDGNLLRTAMVQASNPFTQGGVGGRVEKIDWNGNLVWSFNYFGTSYCTHHDIEYMPNGNILMIAWEKKTLAEAKALGRNTANANYSEVWSEKIIEVKPTGSSTGTIIWEWHIWDHLIQDFDSTKANFGIVSNHPELFDINFGDQKVDWLHFNSIRYNSSRDEIMVSVHAVSEFWIIDHSTTTLQAAGHSGGNRGKGGDLLYRWGNPIAYKSGTKSDQKLFSQHDARWIDDGLSGAGNIMIFNNGTNRSINPYSSIEQIVPPIASDSSYLRTTTSTFGPSSATWQYKAQPDTSFFAENISGATRMPNGNTLICSGPTGKLFEVTSSGQIVWTYINPVATSVFKQGEIPSDNMVFKIYRYSPTYSGLTGKDLSPLGKIELSNATSVKDMKLPSDFLLSQNYPNPFNPSTTINYQIPKETYVELKIYNTFGQEVKILVNKFQSAGNYKAQWDGTNDNNQIVSSGFYFYQITADGLIGTKKMILMK